MTRHDGVRVRENGLDAAIDFVESLRDTDDVHERLDAALSLMSAEMWNTVPVRTGYLRSTSHHYSESTEDEWTGTYEIGRGVPYLNWVYPEREVSELDHVFNDSEPLFRAAFDGWLSGRT